MKIDRPLRMAAVLLAVALVAEAPAAKAEPMVSAEALIGPDFASHAEQILLPEGDTSTWHPQGWEDYAGPSAGPHWNGGGGATVWALGDGVGTAGVFTLNSGQAVIPHGASGINPVPGPLIFPQALPTSTPNYSYTIMNLVEDYVSNGKQAVRCVLYVNGTQTSTAFEFNYREWLRFELAPSQSPSLACRDVAGGARIVLSQNRQYYFRRRDDQQVHLVY